MLKRLCKVFERLCFGALIILLYMASAEVINDKIYDSTPSEAWTIEKEATIFDQLEDGEEIGDTITRTIIRKPDMFQLVAPFEFGDDEFNFLLLFVFVTYPLIYVINGKVRFLPWN